MKPENNAGSDGQSQGETRHITQEKDGCHPGPDEEIIAAGMLTGRMAGEIGIQTDD